MNDQSPRKPKRSDLVEAKVRSRWLRIKSVIAGRESTLLVEDIRRRMGPIERDLIGGTGGKRK